MLTEKLNGIMKEIGKTRTNGERPLRPKAPLGTDKATLEKYTNAMVVYKESLAVISKEAKPLNTKRMELRKSFVEEAADAYKDNDTILRDLCGSDNQTFVDARNAILTMPESAKRYVEYKTIADVRKQGIDDLLYHLVVAGQFAAHTTGRKDELSPDEYNTAQKGVSDDITLLSTIIKVSKALTPEELEIAKGL